MPTVAQDSSIRRAALCAPMLDPETEQDYLRRIQRRNDPVALNALLVSHLRLVMSVAQKYTGHGLALEDLIAEGNLGLVEAARRFDLEKGTRFSTYAAWWVRALIRRFTIANRRIVGAPSTRNARRLLSGLRKTQRELAQQLGATPTREQVAARLEVTPDEVDMVEAALSGRDLALGPTPDGGVVEVAGDLASPEQEAAEREAHEHNVESVRRALDKLDPRERIIVERRLLSDDRDTLADIGQTMGLSRERVRQIELRACQKLREELYEAASVA
ncbi:MAG: sigma-70 family RNA polymerase sigma factor [Sandaracinaceae bacterium]|nr:sigma-70 family RNA polymerase sigma factor [Sandaracinaceae bacterium]